MMKSFKEWLETTALYQGSDIGTIPPVDDDDDNGDDENFWHDKITSQIFRWAEADGPCFKKMVSNFSNALLNADEGYEPEQIIPNTNVVSTDGGYFKVQFEWKLPFDSPQFEKFESETKQILLKGCDLWRYLEFSQDKIYPATQNDYFMNNFLYYFQRMGLILKYVNKNIQFATYELIRKNAAEDYLDSVVDSYNDRYYRSNKTMNNFNFIPTEIEPNYHPSNRGSPMAATGMQRYAFKVH